jgi:hypothetical protein
MGNDTSLPFGFTCELVFLCSKSIKDSDLNCFLLLKQLAVFNTTAADSVVHFSLLKPRSLFSSIIGKIPRSANDVHSGFDFLLRWLYFGLPLGLVLILQQQHGQLY